ncbi:hypothetical protein GOBAR_AA00926 [Gossypium barbadense]|uniref:Uncharacterized protein n=1 Tax=Gossypium barbadense TaxID=3634 RepID=A0A2P5YVJ6_GOSBA|nr:hypothetical protein GOBAR_AA00926 [Gossypium barbadense]
MWNPQLTQTNQAARLMLKLDLIDARFMSHKGGNQMGLAIMVRYRLGEPNLKMMKRVRESGMAMAMSYGGKIYGLKLGGFWGVNLGFPLMNL